MSDLPMSTQAAELLRQRDRAREVAVALEQRLARVEALLPRGPRPWVDLHSIGQWHLALEIRAALEVDQ